MKILFAAVSSVVMFANAGAQIIGVSPVKVWTHNHEIHLN
jgi:hypothetical protein